MLNRRFGRRHLDRPCLLCRHPYRRAQVRHGHLPPQNRLVPTNCQLPRRASSPSPELEESGRIDELLRAIGERIGPFPFSLPR
jgi:hypothetical protein